MHHIPGNINGLAKTIINALCCLVILFLLNVVSYIIPSPFFTLAALIVFIYFIVSLAKFAPATFVLLVPYLVLRATVLLSGVSIEFGAEMVELELIGYATGSMIRLVMVYIFFVTVASLVIESIYRKLCQYYSHNSAESKIQHQPWVILLFVVFILLTLMALAIGAKAGFPLITGLSRLAFREEASSKLFLLYISNRGILILLLGLVFALAQGIKKQISLILFFITIFVSMLFGEKFTSILKLSVLMFTPYLLFKARHEKINLVKLGLPLTFVVALIMPVILYIYGWNDDPVLAVEKLQNRFAAQAQLWFLADSEMSSLFALDLDSLIHNLKSFFSANSFYYANNYPYTGARYFMYNYMSTDLLSLFLETKALTLTMSFEPYLLMTNGWLGQLLPLFICSAGYAANLSYLVYGIFRADPITIFFAAKLLIWTGVGAMQQGELIFMFGLKTVLLALIALSYEKLLSSRVALGLSNTKVRI
ncbi:MAG: hypothetical protein ACJASL_001175 [Paraglaciecola sp.]|jgi:hypothetical protein